MLLHSSTASAHWGLIGWGMQGPPATAQASQEGHIMPSMAFTQQQQQQHADGWHPATVKTLILRRIIRLNVLALNY
jgi:hypothetical protein